MVGSLGDELESDFTAIGDTINVAARLEGLAAPGEILISESTARLVTGYVRVEAVGPLEVKGKGEPVPAYRVLGLGPRRSPLEGLGPRALSRFVGGSASWPLWRSCWPRLATARARWWVSSPSPAWANPAWCTSSGAAWRASG